MVKEGMRVRMEKKSKEIDTKIIFIRSNLLSLSSLNKSFRLVRLVLVQHKKGANRDDRFFPLQIV
jgi:hypothetical protein